MPIGLSADRGEMELLLAREEKRPAKNGGKR
jgi:hypothetical protein